METTVAVKGGGGEGGSNPMYMARQKYGRKGDEKSTLCIEPTSNMLGLKSQSFVRK